jgi:hypothetical protein
VVIAILQDHALACALLTRQVCCFVEGAEIGSPKVPVGRVGSPVGEAVIGVASNVVVIMV